MSVAAPTSDAIAIAIARELAEHGPPLSHVANLFYVCTLPSCRRTLAHGWEWWQQPENHHERCLWRRARILYPPAP